jgi:hypothetical protein
MIYSCAGVYNFPSIVSSFVMNVSKLPVGALYIAIMQSLLALRFNLPHKRLTLSKWGIF